MTREDTERLWELLAMYRPNDQRLKDPRLKTLWAVTLEPYKPEDVKAAVVDYFRGNKYFPDVSEISMRCPQPETYRRPSLPDAGRPDKPDAAVESMFEKIKALRDKRRSMDVPATMEEARAQGMSPSEWWSLCETMGLNIPEDWTPEVSV